MSGQWQLRIERHGLQRFKHKVRTVGAYQIEIGGVVQPGLSGMMLESVGPGDNSRANNGKRIEASDRPYPLWTQFGAYRSIGYKPNHGIPGERPMPGLALAGTNKRTGILIHPAHPPNLYLSSIGCMNPTRPLGSAELADFWDSRRRVIDLIESLEAFAPKPFEHEVMRPIDGASVLVIGEPDDLLEEPFAEALLVEPASLPISKSSAIKCARWLVGNFGARLAAAANGKPYRVKHLCAIVCQETAYKWVPWIDTLPVQTIVERAVYDASGDYPGTSRSAFPINTDAFRKRFGNAATAMLIEEANLTRRLQGYQDKDWVYKGYGLFQYDLQAILRDPAFFEDRQWYDFDRCLQKVVDELDLKLIEQNGDLWEAVRSYNGSGARARQYAANVKLFTQYCAEVTGE